MTIFYGFTVLAEAAAMPPATPSKLDWFQSFETDSFRGRATGACILYCGGYPVNLFISDGSILLFLIFQYSDFIIEPPLIPSSTV